MLAPSLLDRMKLLALRRSWRLYRSAHTVVTARESGRDLRVPIIRGEGLDFVEQSTIDEHRDLGVAIDRVYEKRTGALVDVGANVGQVLRLLTARDPTIPYLGFEPNPFPYNYLTHFIRENGFACHWVLPCGLSDRMAVVDLMFSGATDSSATVSSEMRTARQYPHRAKVLLARGDDVIPLVLGDVGVALIKIDVEGEEPRVLAGLTETVKKHRPWLIVEVAPYQYFIDGDYPRTGFPELTDAERTQIVRYRKELARSVDDFVRAMNYVVFKLRRDGELTSVATVDPGTSKDFIEINYLAMPAEDAKALS